MRCCSVKVGLRKRPKAERRTHFFPQFLPLSASKTPKKSRKVCFLAKLFVILRQKQIIRVESYLFNCNYVQFRVEQPQLAQKLRPDILIPRRSHTPGILFPYSSLLLAILTSMPRVWYEYAYTWGRACHLLANVLDSGLHRLCHQVFSAYKAENGDVIVFVKNTEST